MAPSTWPGSGPEIRERFRPTTQGVPSTAWLSHPPDGFEVSAGQWGYDIDESTSKVLTGVRSIWFKNTATLSKRLQHDKDHQVPVQAGRQYKAWVVYQCFTTAAEVRAFVRWMYADRATLISTSTIKSGAPSAAGAWIRDEVIVTAPEGAVYAAISFGSGDVVSIYFDEVDMLPAVPLWDVYAGSAESLASGSNTTVKFNTVNDTIDVSYSATTGKATILVPGWYYIDARVQVDAQMTAGDFIYATIVVNGAATRNGTSDNAGGTTATFWAHGLLDLAEGDEVSFACNHNHGSPVTISTSPETSFFSGTRIM